MPNQQDTQTTMQKHTYVHTYTRTQIVSKPHKHKNRNTSTIQTNTNNILRNTNPHTCSKEADIQAPRRTNTYKQAETQIHSGPDPNHHKKTQVD